jgi:hypothetical protein
MPVPIAELIDAVARELDIEIEALIDRALARVGKPCQTRLLRAKLIAQLQWILGGKDVTLGPWVEEYRATGEDYFKVRWNREDAKSQLDWPIIDFFRRHVLPLPWELPESNSD